MTFVKGMTLCERFCMDVVEPLITSHFPGMRHALGLFGPGSEVLGYDDAVSTDHMWGPRFQLFTETSDLDKKAALDKVFRVNLPPVFESFSVHFSEPDMADGGIRHAEPLTEGLVSPLYEMHTPDGFLRSQLGLIPHTNTDWLAVSEHRLLGLSEGRLFVDSLGMGQMLAPYARYPEEVKRWLIASQWALVAEERAFVKRCAARGDMLGARLIGARIAERIMRLCFLHADRYAPYSKWLGTAFAGLQVPDDLREALSELVLGSAEAAEAPVDPAHPSQPASSRGIFPADPAALERPLVRALSLAAELHNRAGLTTPVDTSIRRYFGRDILTIDTDAIVAATLATLQDQALAKTPLVGTFSQVGNYVRLSDPPVHAPFIRRFLQHTASIGHEGEHPLAAHAKALAITGLEIRQHGRVVDTVPLDGDHRRNLYSATKSFTSAAVGIAQAEGLLRLDERLVDCFPESVLAHPDAHLAAATVRDLLTMGLGQSQPQLMGETRPFLEETDWVRHVLHQPFAHAPGSRFLYSNAGPYLAGLLVQRRAGADLVTWLTPRLFAPLGIRRPTWETDPLGHTFGAGGLFLCLSEFARFGQLYLNMGKWEGRQLLPAEWVAESTACQMATTGPGDAGCGYGYLFWRGRGDTFRADGKYGQLSIVHRALDAVITLTAESRHPQEIMDFVTDFVLPRLEA